MPITEKLVSSALAGFLVTVLAYIVQLISSSAVANYNADGSLQPSLNLALPLLAGTLAGAGALTLQWSRQGRPGRKKRRSKRAKKRPE